MAWVSDDGASYRWVEDAPPQPYYRKFESEGSQARQLLNPDGSVAGPVEYAWHDPYANWDGVSATGAVQWGPTKPTERINSIANPGLNTWNPMSSKTSDFLTGGDLATMGAMVAAPWAAGAAAGAGAMTAGDAATLAGMTEGAGVGAAGASASPSWLNWMAQAPTGTMTDAGGGGFDAMMDAQDAYGGQGIRDFASSNGLNLGNPTLGTGLWTGAGALGTASNLAKLINGGNGAGGNGAAFGLNDLLRGIPGALGAIGASQQADAVKELGNKYFGIGAPSRERYEASFKPGFSMMNEPGYADALDNTTRTTLNKLSVGTGTGGIAMQPGALQQTLKDVNSTFTLPAMQNYRNQNAATGGFGAFNSAVPQFDIGATQANANVMNGIGAAAGDIFTPKRSLSDLMRELKVTGY